MKHIFHFLLFFVVLNTATFAQNWTWSQSFGNVKSDKATTIKTDSLGYIYVAGYFSTSITLGTNAYLLNYTANAQSKEIFLAKFDSTGYCLWARSGGQYWDDRVLGMDVDKQGNSVITGTFWEGSGIDIGGNIITGNAWGWGDQCFIAKHDKDGNYLWGNFVCSDAGDDQGLDVALDNYGNVYVAGFMSGDTLYAGGGAVKALSVGTNWQDNSYFLAKFNSAGQPQWARTFGNLPWDTLHNKYIERDIAVCTDNIGGIYVGGGYDHTRTFGNTTLSSNGGYDLFVIKYDFQGNYKWARGGGSRKDDWCNGICSDKRGSIYITGEHRDSLLMDTILVKNYDKRDAFVIKMEAKTGRAIWGKRAGGILGSERGNDIYADTACNVYVCGDIQGGAQFGDSITVPLGGGLQSFIARITYKGKWKWVATGGGTDDEDRGNALAKGLGSQVYLSGFFRTDATFGNTTHPSVGSSDAYFARIQDTLYKTYCPIPTQPTSAQYLTLDQFSVPNAFTPNQDGHNDYFSISTGELEQIDLKIFNRLGEIVYQSKDLNGKGWDGYYQGKPCQEGVYRYVILATKIDGKQGLQQGTITLVR